MDENDKIMTNLSVNLNKIALLRNQRDLTYPSPVHAGETILHPGANGLTVHPRPDQRHITNQDVFDLASMMQNQGWLDKGAEYNIEGYPSADFIALALKAKPDQVTLVPDDPTARTSDHGWRLEQPNQDLTNAIKQFAKANIRVSLFLDAETDHAIMDLQIAQAIKIGANAIELYTEPYAAYFDGKDCHGMLDHYIYAANIATKTGLRVNAGHDLCLENLAYFINHVKPIAEVSIGHAFTADALWLGFTQTVLAYKQKLITNRA